MSRKKSFNPARYKRRFSAAGASAAAAAGASAAGASAAAAAAAAAGASAAEAYTCEYHMPRCEGALLSLMQAATCLNARWWRGFDRNSLQLQGVSMSEERVVRLRFVRYTPMTYQYQFFFRHVSRKNKARSRRTIKRAAWDARHPRLLYFRVYQEVDFDKIIPEYASVVRERTGAYDGMNIPTKSEKISQELS